MPIVSCIIGEGGSGGAIAIAVADRVLMQENAIYSVISPEGCAAILWRDAGEARKAAAAFKPDALHSLELGVIDGIVSEPHGGAQEDHDEAARLLGEALEWRSTRSKERPRTSCGASAGRSSAAWASTHERSGTTLCVSAQRTGIHTLHRLIPDPYRARNRMK